MRVGFTGAQGTGKTTLLRAIESAGLNFSVVPSTARAALRSGYKVNRDADPLSQLVTTVSRVSTEDRIDHDAVRCVSDRTPLDSMAYTCYQVHNVWDVDKSMDYYMEVTRDLVVRHMYKYDHIFYFPVFWTPKEDGVRDGDVNYQQDIDKIIVGLLESYGLEYHTVPKGSTQERLSWLTKTLNL